jgi:peptidoglycan/LPS O-acetylase OafA/YrhL
MAKKIWFKRRYYGWGWRPVSWEGWLTLGIYLMLITLFYWKGDDVEIVAARLKLLIPLVTITTAILIAISYHFGEKPRWQWGGKSIKPPFGRWLKIFS